MRLVTELQPCLQELTHHYVKVDKCTLPLCSVFYSWEVSTWNKPVSHCIPVHPTTQVQVLGDVQFPPFWQGLVQTAAWKNIKGYIQDCYSTCSCRSTWVTLLLIDVQSPDSHCAPFHLSSQVQLSGAVQFPPFRQGLVQVAVHAKLKRISR